MEVSLKVGSLLLSTALSLAHVGFFAAAIAVGSYVFTVPGYHPVSEKGFGLALVGYWFTLEMKLRAPKFLAAAFAKETVDA